MRRDDNHEIYTNEYPHLKELIFIATNNITVIIFGGCWIILTAFDCLTR